MRENLSYPSVREVELSFLRKSWWLFPFFGALSVLVLGGPFWQWVSGADPFPLQWPQIFSLRAVRLALAFLAMPAIWRLGLNVKVSRYLVIPVVLLAVLSMEFLLRTPFAQGPLWQAAQARLDAGQWYMREVCYVRLEEAAGPRSRSPAIVLMGSSQMLHGVDDHLLRELLRPTPVVRRSMFGMSPLKTLSILAYVPFRAEDTCVQYLSELDFTNQDEFPYDWFRPYASWKTLPDVMRCVSLSVRARHWRQVVDYALAATFECWRTRDFLDQIAFHFWNHTGMPAENSASPSPAPPAPATLRYSMAEKKAFHVFARNLEEQKVKLMVFEGDVNPALYSPERLQAKEEIRKELAGFSGMKDYRYVSLEEQGLSIGPEHWRDMTHLNPVGRERLTRRIAQELVRK
jgi:hypothetical protein